MNGVEEFQKLLGCAGRECVYGVRNDVRMLMFGKIETNSDTAWAGVFIVVWHGGNTAEVREPNADSYRGPVHVRRLGQRSHAGGGCKAAGQENSLCVCGTKARVNSE